MDKQNKLFFGLFLALLVLASGASAVFAQEQNQLQERAVGLDTSSIKEDVARQARAAQSIDECKRVLNEFNGQIGDVRAHQLCVSVYGHNVRAATKERVAAMLEEKDAEQVRRIEAVLSSEDEERKLVLLGRERLNRLLAQEDDEGLRTRLEAMEIVRVKKDELLRQRTIAREDVEQARERAQVARSTYKDEKQQFLEEQRSWRNAVSRGDDEAAIAHAKEYLVRAGNVIIASFERTKADARANEGLTEEEVQAIVTSADRVIHRVEELLEQVRVAQTKEEVKVAGKNIVDLWARTRNLFVHQHQHLVATQIREMTSNSQQLEYRLERMIRELQDEGYDVSELSRMLEKYSFHVNNARDYLAQARKLLQESMIEDDRSSAQSARSLIGQAHEELERARSIVRDMWRVIKELRPTAVIDDSADDEYVEVIVKEGVVIDQV